MLKRRSQGKFRPIPSEELEALPPADLSTASDATPSLTKPVPKAPSAPVSLTGDSLVSVSSTRSVTAAEGLSAPIRRSSVLIPADDEEHVEDTVRVGGELGFAASLESAESAGGEKELRALGSGNIRSEHEAGSSTGAAGPDEPMAGSLSVLQQLALYNSSNSSSSSESGEMMRNFPSGATVMSTRTMDSGSLSHESSIIRSRRPSQSRTFSASGSVDCIEDESFRRPLAPPLELSRSLKGPDDKFADIKTGGYSEGVLPDVIGKAASCGSPRNAVKVKRTAALLPKSSSVSEKPPLGHYKSSNRERSGPEQWLKTKTLMRRSSSEIQEPGDVFKQERKLSRQQVSGIGGRAAAKILDKIQKSSGPDEEDNPWFQSKIQSPEELKSPTEGGDPSHQYVKGSKKRFKHFSNLFWKYEKEAGHDSDFDRKSSSSSGSRSTSQSALGDEFGSGMGISRDASFDYERVQEDIKHAVVAKQDLVKVLDLVLCVSERPKEDVSAVLYKYMATAPCLEQAVQLLLHDRPRTGKGAPSLSSAALVPSCRRYREYLVYTFVHGPSRLRKALFAHSKVRGELLAFLKSKQVNSLGTAEEWAFKVHCVTRILNSLLAENPAELSEYLAGRKGFLHSLIRNHIHIPEVVDFVSQLCAANALSTTHSDELRYGAQNATGILLLSDEGICNLLVHMFVETSNPASAVAHEALRWQTQVMCSLCLLELSKRSVVSPKFSKANCSYSSKYIRKVNAALENLNVFANLARVGILLDAGIASIAFKPRSSRCPTRTERNNAAVCALSFMTEMLEMVHGAVDSKSVVTRRTVGSIQTHKLEELVVPKALELIKLLRREYRDKVTGCLRVAIVRAFRCLFESAVPETASRLCDSGVPTVLIETLRDNALCSILQQCVVECVVSAAKRKGATAVHKAWFEAMQQPGGLIEELADMMREQEDGEAGAEDERELAAGRADARSTYRCTVMEIGLVVSRMSQDLTRAQFRALFQSEKVYRTFTGTIERGLGRMQEQRKVACGGPKPEGTVVSVLADAKSLVARLNDYDAV